MFLVRSLGLIAALLMLAACEATPDCADVCVTVQEEGDRVFIVATNGFDAIPTSLALDIDASGMRVAGGRHPVRLEPGEIRIVATLEATRSDPRWRYTYRWVPGAIDAAHDDGVRYRLPWEGGQRWRVMQGCSGTFTHAGKRRYALDVAMPPGTPILAARDGIVAGTQSGFTKGGNDPGLADRANLVRVLHSDGTIGLYTHLRPNGVAVSLGKAVRAGDVLGESGNTGWSTAPHLHFEVYTLDRKLEPRSVRVRLDEQRGPLTCPSRGRVLTAKRG